MDVKLPTVKTHVSHILDKLDVKRRAEAKTAAKKPVSYTHLDVYKRQIMISIS